MYKIESQGALADIMDILDARRAGILLTLMDDTMRFGKLKDNLGLSQKTLSANLHVLETAGLLTRTVFAEVPLRVEYTLTERGYSLKGILDMLRNLPVRGRSRSCISAGQEACPIRRCSAL